MLRPGTGLLQQFGGIHRFMNWPRSVLTDSGGFQIFSLPGSRSITEDGAQFTSYVDRTRVHLSPESSIAAQRAIGADIMMVLDQCVPSTVQHAVAEQAMRLTHRWAQRSLAARGDSPQALFGIVQGASYADLRMQSARVIREMPFEGFAIGGLAVGEGRGEREDCTALVTELLPENHPRYLMGVGTTLDLLEAVHRGVDMFDCILPTALAKQGVAFTSTGRRDLRRAAYRTCEEPLDPACGCSTCSTYSIAYLYHLKKVSEPQGWQLLGLHNVHFYMRLMRTMREHILGGTWLGYYRQQRELLDARDNYGPPVRHVTKAQRQQQKRHLGRYEVVVGNGSGRIREVASGEIMHPVDVPAEEARLLYVEQSRLLARLQQTIATPLVVWDVGLGAATNAMAVIHAVEALRVGTAGIPPLSAVTQPSGGPLREGEAQESMATPGAAAPALARTTRGEMTAPVRPLTLVSFENDLDSLVLALRHPAWFRHLRHAAPRALLAEERWTSRRAALDWRLLRGDFSLRKHDAPLPDVIFFDPFSFKTDPALWTLNAFRELATLCAARPVELYTYTYSTRVRAAMLAAGFYVAKGRGTGPKAETTIGLSPLAAAAAHGHALLGAQWLEKWRRSDAQVPLGAAAEDDSWRTAVSAHPQFHQASTDSRGPR